MPSKAKRPRNTSSKSKKSKSNKLNRFIPRSRPLIFVMLFAIVGVLGLIIANALTTNFSFSGQLSGYYKTRSYSVNADNTGNLTASLTWDRKTEVNFKISDGSGAVVFNKTSASSPINVAIPVTKGAYKLIVSKVGWNTKFILKGTVNTSDPSDTTAPTAPGNLRAVLTNADTASLTWTASTDNVGIANYKVYRNGTLMTTTSNTGYTNSGLAAGTTYAYSVTAYDAAGNPSPSSNTASVATSGTSTGTPPEPTPTTTGSWEPPADWESYTSYTAPAGGGTITLESGKNYKIVAPNEITGPITIKGGRNIVWIGGVFGGRTTAPSGTYDSTNRGIRIYDGDDVARTIYLEGLWFKPGTYLSDAIQFAIRTNNSVTAIVQNMRVDSINYGTKASVHADVIQAWGGPRTLLIDGLTAKHATYQGFYLDAGDGRTLPSGAGQAWVTRRVNIEGDSRTGGARYLLADRQSAFTKMISDRVYIIGACCSSTDSFGSWPSSGLTQNAKPPGGDWVPATLWNGTTYTPPSL